MQREGKRKRYNDRDKHLSTLEDVDPAAGTSAAYTQQKFVAQKIENVPPKCLKVNFQELMIIWPELGLKK